MSDLSPPLARLASDSDCEVLGCVAPSAGCSRSRASTFNDLAAMLTQPVPVPTVRSATEWVPTTWAELARWVIEHDEGRLRPRDRDFAASMARLLAPGGEPTPRQAEWLRDLAIKLGGDAMTAAEIATLMEPVARQLLGEPNPALSNGRELRFGTRGSLSVNLDKGIWHDHEKGEGGGVLDLIRREIHVANGDGAVRWLEEHGYAEPPTRKAGFADRIVAHVPLPLCGRQPRLRRRPPARPEGLPAAGAGRQMDDQGHRQGALSAPGAARGARGRPRPGRRGREGRRPAARARPPRDDLARGRRQVAGRLRRRPAPCPRRRHPRQR